MSYKGVVKGHAIELAGEATPPEGRRVSIIPEPPIAGTVPPYEVAAACVFYTSEVLRMTWWGTVLLMFRNAGRWLWASIVLTIWLWYRAVA
jgi:hypothetical protein